MPCERSDLLQLFTFTRDTDCLVSMNTHEEQHFDITGKVDGSICFQIEFLFSPGAYYAFINFL